VNPPIQETPEVPVWAREEAFPEAPAGWGWVDAKEKRHPCDSVESLTAAIRDDKDGSVNLVWTPGHRRMILPEELSGMADALRTARERWTRDDLEDAAYRLRWFGLILAGSTGFALYRGFAIASQPGVVADLSGRLKFAAQVTLSSTLTGLALLMFVIFAFIPWYQARKRRADLGKWSEAGLAESAPTLRFETWLAWQKSPVTKFLLGLMLLVGAAQMMPGDSLAAAGLVKARYFQGEWWRLLTAPFLHGNIVHFLMNAAALLYLGKRLEVFARWPHLPLVFLFAACVGGEASARFVAAPSVGASGGLMGWLGFLMVFETLHKRLVPRRARRRLAAGVFLTALIGVIGYRYIDNAAHAGGLLAGMAYAVIVFPPTASPHRPRSTVMDRVAGGMALAMLTAAALFATLQIIGG
jgi:membrane associated rhomboid family serine protease